MAKPPATERQYWLWVTRPEYYLDEDGTDREDLDPDKNPDSAGWWWTCHKDTKRGDLVFLWRTSPKKDIGYLMQAKSDAYSLVDDAYAASQRWDWGCDYRVLYKFKNPVTIQELREHPHLQNWKPLRAGFRCRAPAFRILPEDWKELNLLTFQKNLGYETFLKDVEGTTVVKSIDTEEKLRRELVQNLGMLKRFGYDLELYVDLNTGRNGREFVCKGHGGRIDLLCYDKKQHCFVVIELKNVPAGRNTFGQVSAYVGWVEGNLPSKKSIRPGKKPIGLVMTLLKKGFNHPLVGQMHQKPSFLIVHSLKSSCFWPKVGRCPFQLVKTPVFSVESVISRGYNTQFGAALKITDKIKHLNVSNLGFR